MKKFVFLTIWTHAFIFTSLLLNISLPAVFASDDEDTLTRNVWACRGTELFQEFRTAKLEGRKSIVNAYKKKGICVRVKAGTAIHILGSEGTVEGALITFRRKGRFEGLTTEEWYGLSAPGSFRRVTENTLKEAQEKN